MGVLNVTPDSFYDGGRYDGAGSAIASGLEMARRGADIIDVGGESTRPGAESVGLDEELSRVIPVIDGLAKRSRAAISVDTRKARVAEEAIRHGAVLVNDVSGLRYDKGMARVVASSGTAVMIMHMRGEPRDMQTRARYGDVVKDVIDELEGSIAIALGAGIRRESIIVDPGIGFAKTAEQSLEMLGRLAELRSLGRPICVGVSRKSFIGRVTGEADPASRLGGTIAACAIAVMNGADILRVHDVAEARQAAAVARAAMNIKAG
jgi:dihydropteroate synthase